MKGSHDDHDESGEEQAGREEHTHERDDAVRWRILEQAVASKASALHLPPEYRTELAQRAFVSSASRGEVIVPTSATPNFFSFVAQGSVAIVVYDDRGRRSIVQIAKPGFIFSLTPFVSRRERRRFAAIAFEDSVIASVDRQIVHDVLCRLGPEHHMGLLMYMCRALSRLIYDRARLFRIEVADRLLQQLVELARHFSQPDRSGVIDLPLRQHDLADLVGSSRAVACRGLSTLMMQGLVSRMGGRYCVAPAVLARRSVRMVPVQESTGELARGEAESRERLHAVLRTAWRSLGSPGRAITTFRDGATLYRYRAGDVIGTGERPTVTLLVDGAARVECVIPGADPVGIRIASSGQFVGVGWAVDGPDRQRRFRAVALTDALVARVGVGDMKRVVTALDADQMLELLALYSNILSRQIYDRCVLLPMTVKRRVDYVLRSLADEFPRPHPSGTVIDLPQHEDDIAVLVGAHREAVCRRAIAPGKRAGEISVVDGHLLLQGYRATPQPDGCTPR